MQTTKVTIRLSSAMIWALLALSIGPTHGGGNRLTCQRIESFFTTICPGVTPTSRLSRNIEGIIDNAVSGLEAKMDSLERKLEEILSQLGNAVTGRKKDTADCDMFYQDKCFKPIVKTWANERMNFSQGKASCEEMGAKLANIYSLELYNMIVSTLRNAFPPCKTWLTLWLGMTIEPPATTVYFSDGTEAPSFPWYESFPKMQASYMYMSLDVNADPYQSRQGMANYPAVNHRLGAICEFDVGRK